MGTPNPPSRIYGSSAAPPSVDAVLQQDAAFRDGPLYRAYVDSQIRGCEFQIVRALLSGVHATLVLVDPTSSPIQTGQWVCLAGSVDKTVTLANLAAVSTAGEPVGIALAGGAPGTWILIGMEGVVPPSITGLPINGNNVFACLNTTTGFTQTKSSLGTNDYPVGTVDAAGNLNVHIQLAPVTGGGGLSVSGTGFVPVSSGTIGASARAVDLSSNGTGGDVTNVLAWTNGGHIQGHVNVTNASPGTLDATHQIAYCDTSTGTCSATLPNAASFGGAIPADWEVLVIDTGGAAGTSAITVNPNGASIWDPSAQAFGSSNVSLATNGIASWWKWDANKSHWTLINSGGGGGAVPAPASTISSNTTITSAQQWVLFTGAGGGYTITLQNMVAGILYRLTHVGPTGIESPNTVTLSRGTATFTIESPQDRTAAAANTQVIDASYQTYHLMLDKTNNVVRCLGVI